jgi:hypothetical protein
MPPIEINKTRKAVAVILLKRNLLAIDKKLVPKRITDVIISVIIKGSRGELR